MKRRVQPEVFRWTLLKRANINLKTELYIRANLGRDKDTDSVFKLGQMVHDTRDSGLIIRLTAEGCSITSTETFLTETGRSTKQMDLELITTLMGASTKVCGWMTFKMEKAERLGKTRQPTRASIKRVRNTVRVFMFGPMEVFIAVHG